MLQQLLVNLIQNASLHAPESTHIRIESRYDDTGAFLAVCDNGPGIPERDIDKVLDPFVRLDSARTSGGSGLGLALVQAIAEHHNAKLMLTNTNPGLKVELQFSEQRNQPQPKVHNA
jgi:signal transduction histidine kinase